MSYIVAFVAIALPVLTGYLLGRAQPEYPAPKAALLAATPLLAVFLGFAFYLHSTEGPAPFGLAAVIVFGVVALLCGFGLGIVGHMLGLKSARK